MSQLALITQIWYWKTHTSWFSKICTEAQFKKKKKWGTSIFKINEHNLSKSGYFYFNHIYGNISKVYNRF